MFELRLNNVTLKLPEDFEIDYELRHPFTGNGEIQGSYTVPGDLPYCPHNEKALNEASCIEIRNRVRIYENAAALFEGIYLIPGKLVIINSDRNLTSGAYKFTFLFNGFSVDILEKSLKDLDWDDDVNLGADTDDVIQHALDASTGVFTDYNYAFPMHRNVSFYGDSNAQFSGIVNAFNGATGEYLKNTSTSNAYNLVPFLSLKYVYDVIFKGYRITGSWFQGTRAKALLYNNFALDRRLNRYHVRAAQVGVWSWAGSPQPTTVDNLTDESTPPNEDPDNVYDNVGCLYEVQNEGTHKLTAQIEVRVTDNTPLMLKRANITFYNNGQLFGTVQVNGLVYNVWETVDVLAYAALTGVDVGTDIEFRVWFEQSPIGGLYSDCTGEAQNGWIEIQDIAACNENIYDTNLHYANHVPDIQVADFLESFRKAGMVINVYPFKREVQIDYIDRTFDLQPINVTDKVHAERRITFADNKGYLLNFQFPDSELKPEELPKLNQFGPSFESDTFFDMPKPNMFNEICFVKQLNAFYVVEIDTTTDEFYWKFLCYNFYNLVLGEGDEEFMPEFSPMQMIIRDFLGFDHLIPDVDETGSSAVFSMGVNDPAFKILFWHGFVANENGDDYPFASPYDLDYEGNVVGDITLRYDDTVKGHYKLQLKKWMENLLIADRYKVYLNVDGNFISELDFIKPLRIDNQHYAIDVLSGSYKEKRLTEAETDLIKL